MSGIATSRRTVIALAAAALLPLGPVFAATSAGASITLSDFTYRVVDLDPTDGIAPSFTTKQLPVSAKLGIANGGVGAAYTATPTWTGSLAPATSTTITDPQGSIATIAPDGLTVSTQFDTLTTGASAHYLDQRNADASVTTEQAGDGLSTDPLTGNTYMDTHVVGARTMLVIEGTVTVRLTADAYAAVTAAGTSAGLNSFSNASSSVNFSATLAGGYYLPDPEYPGGASLPVPQSDIRDSHWSDLYFFKSIGSYLSFSESGELLPNSSVGVSSLEFTVPLRLTLANVTDSAFYSALFISSNASSHASANLAQPIPEPGTWALMGLGLAGVALARRRPGA